METNHNFQLDGTTQKKLNCLSILQLTDASQMYGIT